MGKFNVFPKIDYIYFKLYLKDEFSNVYIHEDLTTVETIWTQLSNTTVNTHLTVATRLAAGKALNALTFKILVVQSAPTISSFAATVEGAYSLKLVTNGLGVT